MRVLIAALFLLAQPLAASAKESVAECSIQAQSPWISRWFVAWELTARDILQLPGAPAPSIVFFDSVCVFTTSSVTAGGAPPEDGPRLHGARIPWHATAHDDSVTLPDGSRVPVQLMSFARSDKRTGPFFVMAAPSLWSRIARGPDDDPGLAVFLHEFAHTRQIRGLERRIGPIDSAWSYPEELDDDAVQKHFGADSAYVAAYLEERDLFYRAAAAATREECSALTRQALARMKQRHHRWFVGDKVEFATLDDVFLSLEGAAQWAAVAWLDHPEGGGLTQEAAVAKMLGRRRWWVQDEGLALFLAVDRLLPGWPRLVFADPSMGALELLERAVQ